MKKLLFLTTILFLAVNASAKDVSFNLLDYTKDSHRDSISGHLISTTKDNVTLSFSIIDDSYFIMCNAAYNYCPWYSIIFNTTVDSSQIVINATSEVGVITGLTIYADIDEESTFEVDLPSPSPWVFNFIYDGAILYQGTIGVDSNCFIIQSIHHLVVHVDESVSSIVNTNVNPVVSKYIEDGQVVIVRDGIYYNCLGNRLY